MKILNYIEGERSFYDQQTIEIPGNEDYSQSQLIHSINCSRLSKYKDDNAKDDIIGDYPYDNVTKYRIRLEARATDFDPKHIDIEPINGSREARVSAMIGTKVLRKYMRNTDFGAFLDRYADTRPEYGGFLAKKTKDGIDAVPWENVVTDMSDIMGGVIIERHYMKPSALKKTNWKNVNDVIATASEKKKKQDMKQNGADEAETITDLIEIWEMHGEIDKATYEEALSEFDGTQYDFNPDDELEFVQCQIIVAPQGKDEHGDMKGMILQANEESEFPYKYDARNPIVGRGLGEGIPEELSEHQRWHNFYKTEEARAVAIGGKVLFVTNDGNVVDSIYDEGIEHGSILQIGDAEGKFFNQLSTLPTSVPLYQDIRADWDASGDKVTSSFDTKLGAEAKSGTTFRGQYIEDENANSQFLQYREQMGRFIREIVEDWVLPDALAEACKEDEIYESFSKAELQMIDEVIIAKAMTDRYGQILTQEKRPVSMEEQEAIKIGLETSLAKLGNKRSVKDIKRFLTKDVVRNVVIHTTDEDRSKAVLFESYSNLLQMFDPMSAEAQAIKDKIMDMLGISRDELALYAEEAAVQQQQQPMKLNSKELVQQDTQEKVIPTA